MKRDELHELIRQAARLTGDNTVLLVGSQAILGTWDADELPARATLSAEADLAGMVGDPEVIADLIDAEIGEFSDFHQANGFYGQGVELNTVTLPRGWQQRAETITPDGPGGPKAVCIGPYDLCASKLVRGEEKDMAFVGALVDDGKIDPVALERITRRLPLEGSLRSIVIGRAGAFRDR